MDRRAITVILAIAGAVLAVRLPSYFAPYPLNPDEAEFLFAAFKLSQGGMPYRDFFIYHPPLIFYFYRLATWLSGDPHGLLAVRLLGAVVSAGTALTVAGIAAVLGWGRVRAVRAGLFSALFGIAFFPKDMMAVHCELLAILPLSLAVLFFLKGERDSKWGWLVAAGIAAGVAGLVKYQAFVALPLLLVWGIGRSETRWVRLATGLSILIGCGVVIGEFYGWLKAHGLVSEFGASFKYILGYAMGPVDNQSLAYLTGKFVIRLLLVILASFPLWWLGGAAFLSHSRLFLWLVLALVASLPGGRFFYHYFILLQPPLCLLAAARPFPAVIGLRRAVTFACGALPLIFFLYGWSEAFKQRESAAPWMRVGEAIRSASHPGESLFVWGNVPQLYTVSRLAPATRFTTADYLTGHSPGTPGQWAAQDLDRRLSAFDLLKIDFFGDDRAVRRVDRASFAYPGARGLLIEDFNRRPPDWIVDVSTSDQTPYAAYSLRRQFWIYPWILKNYEVERTVEGFTLYRAKRAKPTALQANPRIRRMI